MVGRLVEAVDEMRLRLLELLQTVAQLLHPGREDVKILEENVSTILLQKYVRLISPIRKDTYTSFRQEDVFLENVQMKFHYRKVFLRTY